MLVLRWNQRAHYWFLGRPKGHIRAPKGYSALWKRPGENPGPNPKQPFSRAEDCEQFCYRGRGDNSRAVFTVIDHITQTLHYSNARPRFRPNWASSGACGVQNAYMQDYIYLYNMACDVKRTHAIQTLQLSFKYLQLKS